jgi:hypothetical protein
MSSAGRYWLRMTLLAGGVLLLVAQQTPAAARPIGPGSAFPPAFITKTFLIDPTNNYFDNTMIWFDSVTDRQRVDIHVFHPNPLDTVVLLRFDLASGYQFEPVPFGANCFSFALSTDLTPFEFSDQAEVVGKDQVVGRKVTKVLDPLSAGGTGEFRVRRGKHGFLHPLDVFTRDGPTLVNYQSWFDLTAFKGALPDQSVFDVPDVCPAVASTPPTSSAAGRSKGRGPKAGLPWDYRRYLPSTR